MKKIVIYLLLIFIHFAIVCLPLNASSKKEAEEYDKTKIGKYIDLIYELMKKMNRFESEPDLELIKQLNLIGVPPPKDQFETTAEYQARLNNATKQVREALIASYQGKYKAMDQLRDSIFSVFFQFVGKKYQASWNSNSGRQWDNAAGKYVDRFPRYNADDRTLTVLVQMLIQPFINIVVERTFKIEPDEAKLLLSAWQSSDSSLCEASFVVNLSSSGSLNLEVDEFRIKIPGSDNYYILQGESVPILQSSGANCDAEFSWPKVVDYRVSEEGDILALCDGESITVINYKNGKTLATVKPKPGVSYSILDISLLGDKLVISRVIGDMAYFIPSNWVWEWQSSKWTEVDKDKGFQRGGGGRPMILNNDGKIVAYSWQPEAKHPGIPVTDNYIATYILSDGSQHVYLDNEIFSNNLLFLKGSRFLLAYKEMYSVVHIYDTEKNTLIHKSSLGEKTKVPMISLDGRVAKDRETGVWFPVGKQVLSNFFGLPQTSIKKVPLSDEERRVSMESSEKDIWGQPTGSMILRFYQIRQWSRLSQYLAGDYGFRNPILISEDEMEWHGYPSMPTYAYDMDRDGLPELFLLDASNKYTVYNHETGLRLLEITCTTDKIRSDIVKMENGIWDIRVMELTSNHNSAFSTCHFIYNDINEQKLKTVELNTNKNTLGVIVDFDNDGIDEYIINLDSKLFSNGKLQGKNIKILHWQNSNLEDVTKKYAKYLGKKL